MPKIPFRLYTILGILIAASIESCYNQTKSFEGIIKYKINYESNSPVYTADKLTTFYGDTSIVYIKDGKYRQDYPNAKGVSNVFYDPSSNNYYIKFKLKDTLFFINANSTKQSYDFKFNDTKDSIILGYNCKSASLIIDNLVNTFYYAPSLPLAYEPFKNHKYGGYNILTANIKSVYLANYSKYKDYSRNALAFYIKEVKLHNSIFSLKKYRVKKKMHGT